MKLGSVDFNSTDHELQDLVSCNLLYNSNAALNTATFSKFVSITVFKMPDLW